MHDGEITIWEKMKKNGIKDLIVGALLFISFGGATLYGVLTNSIEIDGVTIILLSLVTLQGIVVIGLGIWELHLSRKYFVWNKETEELELRKEEALRALKEAKEEAEELNKLNTYGGPTNDTEANSTAN